MKQQTISTCFSTASSKLSPESGLSLYKAANYTSVSSKNTAESLSPEDVAKIQRNRVAATIRRFAHYLKEPQWKERLQPEFSQAYFFELMEVIDADKQNGVVVLPPEHEVFAAFNFTPFDQVKVVILGQDPYHGLNQAHGLAFSVRHGVPPPPSLKNIFAELASDPDVSPPFKIPSHGNLEPWAKQGVLLLNAVLTVQLGMANSHANKGWERFTDAAIRHLSDQRRGLVFLLWGVYAQKKAALIDTTKHHILTAAHPSPLSAQRFFGCRHFSRANRLLVEQNQTPVDWTLHETTPPR